MSRKIRFLIASGPTREPLDPVRYLSNYSTGTMGKCLVKAAMGKRHQVTWIECPKKAETALKLERILKRLLPKHDVLIMAAAVCDVRPHRVSGIKIKKEALSNIQLTKNPDILMSLSSMKRKNQIFVGFGLESENLLKNGFKKLKQKNLDLIVLQKITNKINPFGDKLINVFLLAGTEDIKTYRLIHKQKLAKLIIEMAGKLAEERL